MLDSNSSNSIIRCGDSRWNEQPWRRNLVFGSILVLALSLRVWPVSFPVDLNPDEENVVTRSLRIGRDGLNPKWFKYPPLFLYTLFATYAARFGVEKAVGLSDSARSFAEKYFTDPLPFFVQGRLVSALFGVAAVWALAVLARRLSFSWKAAVSASAVLAVSPLLVELSRFALTDGPTLFPFILSLLMAALVLERGRGREAFAAGIFAGLAAATKYPAGVAIFGVVAAAYGRSKRCPNEAWGRLVLSGLGGLVLGFLAVCPWAILDFDRFWQYLSLLWEHVPNSWAGGPANRGYIPYLVDYLPAAVGWPLFVAGISGLCLWFRRDRGKAAIALAPALVYWIIMGAARTHFARFSLPMLPVLALGGAWWLDHVPRKFGPRSAIPASIFILLLVPPLARAVNWNVRTSFPDTRSLATHWIEENIPPGSRILAEAYGPRLATTRARAREIADTARMRDPGSGAKFDYLATHEPEGRPDYHLIVIPLYERSEGISDYELSWYAPERVDEARIEWLIRSSTVYERFGSGTVTSSPRAEFSDWLVECWEEVTRFGHLEPPPQSAIERWWVRLGPTVVIFRRKAPAPESCRINE